MFQNRRYGSKPDLPEMHIEHRAESTMAYDLVIKNGTIVDGSGKPRFHGDVAIEGSKIAEVGKANGSAKRTIDAPALVVAPVFADPHTHYDAPVCSDPMFTSA